MEIIGHTVVADIRRAKLAKAVSACQINALRQHFLYDLPFQLVVRTENCGAATAGNAENGGIGSATMPRGGV